MRTTLSKTQETLILPPRRTIGAAKAGLEGPRAAVHFLGGAFVGAVPRLTYEVLIEVRRGEEGGGRREEEGGRRKEEGGRRKEEEDGGKRLD